MIPRFREGEEPIRAVERVFRSAPLHWHTFYEVEFTVTGRVLHIINGKEYRTCPGFVSIMTPCDFHQYVDSGCESRIKKVYFSDWFISPEIVKLILAKCVNRCAGPDTETSAGISALMDELIAMKPAGSDLDMLIRKNLVERLCLLIVQTCESADEMKPVGPSEYGGTSLLSRVLTYIAEHFGEKVTLEEAANTVHLSPNYLSHLFSRSLGITFQQYVKFRRVSYASFLLLTTDYAVDEIAYRSGFTSTSFFNNTFREQYGVTPHLYRSSSRNRSSFGS